MKKNLNILALAIALLAVQACGSKTETENKEVAAKEITAPEAVVLTVAERKAKLEKEKAERIEQRKIAREKLAATSLTYTDATGDVVYHKVESDPSFNGGNDAMLAYLHDNMKFPESARDKGVEGTVFVDFVVGKSGIVREVEVTEATSDEVDQSFRVEAIRVVSAMPKWLPGRQQGKVVSVKFSIPITFELQ
jgi:TonB family protein